jgi:hypothetical protein
VRVLMQGKTCLRPPRKGDVKVEMCEREGHQRLLASSPVFFERVGRCCLARPARTVALIFGQSGSSALPIRIDDGLQPEDRSVLRVGGALDLRGLTGRVARRVAAVGRRRIFFRPSGAEYL